MAKAARILVVEDEAGLMMTVLDRLRATGYNPRPASDGATALACLDGKDWYPDLVILDIMLPDTDGFAICRHIRQHDTALPVLMLTARSAVEDRVRGLRGGADDYLTKPFSLAELVARVEALLRRARGTPVSEPAAGGPPATSQVHFGTWRLNVAAHTLVAGDGTVQDLSATEFRLLHHLVSNPGRVFSREDLLDEVWSYNNEVNSRTVDVHIASLRRKLGESVQPHHIQTIRRSGYRFEA